MKANLSSQSPLTKGNAQSYIASMAKQTEDYFIEGTLDDLTFYKMDGTYYVRMKSSLTAKRLWKSKAFERSRQSCKRFAEGNQLASKLYKMIEEEKRTYQLFCFLKKRAIQLLKEGKSSMQAEGLLMDYLFDFNYLVKSEKGSINQPFIPPLRSFEENIDCRYSGPRRREFQLNG